MEKRQFHWEVLASMVLFLGTILGVVIPLHLQTQQQISTIHAEIHAEMKDFHGRLCAIEERNRGK
jgi:hypothetical protein